MERKNTILLTVIAVATLLVAVVGATFAYFTASTAVDNNQASVNADTKVVGTGTVTLTATNVTNQYALDYPGGYAIVGLGVTATDTDNTAAYTANYSVNYAITNATETNVKYAIYKSDTNIFDTSTNTGVLSCTGGEHTGNGTNWPVGETRWFYDSCTGVDVYEALTPVTGFEQPVAVGKDGIESTFVGEVLTSAVDNETAATADYYYYIVVEYPNNAEASQNDDQGDKITVTLGGITGQSTAVVNQ